MGWIGYDNRDTGTRRLFMDISDLGWSCKASQHSPKHECLIFSTVMYEYCMWAICMYV